MKFDIPQWYDLHAHFRQGDIVPHLINDHAAMGCAGILAMPNTAPPIAKVHEADRGDHWSIEAYQAQLSKAGADQFQSVIVPLYLTQETTPQMIEAGAKSGMLTACKYYPPHGTTGAQFGAPLDTFINNGVFAAMEAAGIILCIHGEEHGLSGAEYFDQNHNAETRFYTQRMPQLAEKFPQLKVVCEHITTRIAADFVNETPSNIAATITPQHLLYTVGHLLQGFKYHLFCLPLIKFEGDREALRAAVTSANNTQFFAGTDSAPHTNKLTECGCAAGCYTGGIAPQLYAQGFEEAGCDLSSQEGQNIFTKFLSLNGPAFYGLPAATQSFTLAKQPQRVVKREVGANTITPLPLGMAAQEQDETTIPWSII